MSAPAMTDPAMERAKDRHNRRKFIDGATWLIDTPTEVSPVWGEGDRVLWSAGEPLMIVGPDGSGKTTVGGHLLFALAGIVPAVLGFPVKPAERRVFYAAADRPNQAQRRFRQILEQHASPGDLERMREQLQERVVIHKGPLPFDIVREEKRLATFVEDAGADVAIFDSLGALHSGLAKDEVGSAIRSAVDHVIDVGIDVAELHHNRKENAENREPRKLADVYGSRWLTAGCGSVISLWGEPGASVVALRHLKQPAAEVGPFHFDVSIDGWISVREGTNIRALLAQPGGVSAREAAAVLYEKPKPTLAEVERARRTIERELRRGWAVELLPAMGQNPARYGLPPSPPDA